MIITVSTPLKGKEIIELLSDYNENGISFKYISNKGIRYDFEVDGLEKDAAISLVKEIIRATQFGKVLYFSVLAE